MKKIMAYVSYVIRSYPKNFMISCLMYLLSILFAAGLYGVASLILSMAALRPTYDTLMIPVVCVRLFGLGRAVLSYADRYFSHDFTFKVLKKLRLRLFDRMVPVLPNCETRRAENLSKLISDIELLQEGILRLVYPITASLLVLLLGSLIAWAFHPMLLIAFVLLFLINDYGFPFLILWINARRKDSIDFDKKNLYADLLEMKEGFIEMVSEGREEDWRKRIDTRLSAMHGNQGEYDSLVAFSDAILVFLQGMSTMVLLFLSTYLCWKGELPGVQTAAATLALSYLVTEGMLPSQTLFQFRDLKRAAKSVFEEGSNKPYQELPLENTIANPQETSVKSTVAAQTQETPQKSMVSAQQLELCNVSFAYRENDMLLSDFSLELKKGFVTVLIGESGCGKTTLTNLLLGFLQPREGLIRIDGQELQQISLSERLQYFSVVEQKPFFFHQSIYDNLRLADPKAEEERMREVLRQVSLEEVLENSENGIHTQIYEWGANLSGGELQRLAIARTLLKQAPFYIFDEPTAGLDTMNEKKIMELIFNLSEEHGVLLITHRPDTVDRFPNVIKKYITKNKEGSTANDEFE